MCGIAGVFRPSDAPVEKDEIRRMLDLIAHRGPDGSGVHIDRHVGLGHVRLAILDLSDAAAQPMVSHDGRYVLTFNGEIFNFREQRKRLEERGIRVRSSGDTEVLLELLAAFGVDEVLPRLEGFFAFGLWDRQQHSLLIARDRHGIKPLYYRSGAQGAVHFASEMLPLCGPDTPPDPHRVSAALLGWGCVSGEATLFQGIRHVEPGRWIRFERGGRSSSGSFFQVLDFVDPELHRELCAAPESEVMARVERAFEESIDYRLVSDAPVACLASGGIDSSLVAAAAAQRSRDQLALFHADVAHDSERPYAEALARQLGLPLHTVEMSDESFLDHVPITTRHAEIPLVYHANSVPFYLVSRLVSQHGFKVVLTGEGSDEYFLGYPMIVIERYLAALRRLGSGAQAVFHRAFPRAAGLLWPRRAEGNEQGLHALLFGFAQENLDAEIAARLGHLTRPRERAFAFETLRHLRDHLLTLLHRNDRLGMASGIESRFPFLGLSLARLAVNLPSRYKIRVVPRFYNVRHPFHMDKWAVRWLAARRLPRAIVERPKKGFPISIAERLEVDPRFFLGGSVEEWFGLDRRAVEALPQRVGRRFTFSLLLVEVWAALLCRREPVEQVREHLRRHVRSVS
jgi:asparagine synthase (glutamine-hydrolysing)